MCKFGVVDWTGRWLFDEQRFDSFDAGWARIYAYADEMLMSENEAEDFYDAVHVMPIYDGRPIDWFDPWPDVNEMGEQIEPDDIWVERLQEARAGMLGRMFG